ncbi:transglutaminase family protein [Halalkalibacter sp. APA_J-10(15)]|uniref:transglutaminase-like domain-containing protein n=1 Tax=Halalkalibacter sp. APA_J-10(15) TaxID=2933805 RepID=UPI001FF44AA4|nr:transglutaminase family protein [Halalkalibacter sp. APA_J-10(15)]MCK0471736.1 transglutaminase family protein [Halalkalibacter sp. APA_J-10(15)]
MNVNPEVSKLDLYVQEIDCCNYLHEDIQAKIAELFSSVKSDVEKAKVAFEFVRDEIDHSWDIQATDVTCRASEVLEQKHGMCFAKSNLLAALLRGAGIPTGFCYQRLMHFDTPEEGYSLHGFNAVYLQSLDRWVRIDARGNKKGVQAEFSLGEERLAFPVRREYGEQDDPVIYVRPHARVIAALEDGDNLIELYRNHLPDRL